MRIRLFIIISAIIAGSMMPANALADSPENEFNVGCAIWSDSDLWCPQNVSTPVPFNNELYDTDDMHNNSVNNTKVFIDYPGVYMITACCKWANYPNDEVTIDIRVNGVSQIALNTRYHQATNEVFVNCAGREFESGDYIELYGRSTRNPGNYILSVGSPHYYSPQMTVQRIGIGGDEMDFNIVMPPIFWGMILGLGLMLANAFIGSPFIWLACAGIFFGLYHEAEIYGGYYHAGCIILIIACLYLALNTYRKRRGDSSYG